MNFDHETLTRRPDSTFRDCSRKDASDAQKSISHFYAPGHSDREPGRLSMQARRFEPFTRRLFREAGLHRATRVLDVRGGSGDVALR